MLLFATGKVTSSLAPNSLVALLRVSPCGLTPEGLSLKPVLRPVIMQNSEFQFVVLVTTGP